MSEIKNIDILKFLDGSTKSKKKELIRTWAYESVENAQDLAFTQKIYKESDNLKTFNPVEADLEWDAFKSLVNGGGALTEENIITENTSIETDKIAASTVTAAVPSDLDILNYLEGNALPSEVDELSKWMSLSADNKEVLDLSDKILKESSSLATYKNYNVDSEWNLFKTKTSALTTVASSNIITLPKETSTVSNQSYIQENEEDSGFVIPMWARYAVAASVALLLFSYMWTSTNIFRAGSASDHYAEYATQFNTHEFDMIDGSRIFMDQNTNLRYPENLSSLDERRLYMEGQGQFDVASNKEKPFIVEVNDEIGVRVLGTIFKVFAHEDYLKAVENIEGKVRAFSLRDTSIYVDLGPGDRYGWDGTKFVDMNIKEVIDNSVEYDMLYVLDYLMANSSWKVISSSNMPFDEKGMVKIDLEKDITDILNDLRERADFEYVDLDCDKCFQITRFKELDQ